jgi:hypothetical protein
MQNPQGGMEPCGSVIYQHEDLLTKNFKVSGPGHHTFTLHVINALNQGVGDFYHWTTQGVGQPIDNPTPICKDNGDGTSSCTY